MDEADLRRQSAQVRLRARLAVEEFLPVIKAWDGATDKARFLAFVDEVIDQVFAPSSHDAASRQKRTAKKRLGYEGDPVWADAEFFVGVLDVIRNKIESDDKSVFAPKLTDANDWIRKFVEMLDAKEQLTSDAGTRTRRPPQIPVYFEQDITARIADLAKGDVVLLASGNGFLEQTNVRFAESVAKNVGRGLEYWYVFPAAEPSESVRQEDLLRSRTRTK